MHLFIVSYVAGILTVLAPCVLPLLPVIVGGTVVQDTQRNRRWWRPLTIVGSLAISITIFTLLLKATTILVGVPQIVWNVLASFIIFLFGVSLLMPYAWERLALKSGLYNQSNKLLQKSSRIKSGVGRDVLLGVSLGPVFTSCSPTYLLIVAVVLPRSFVEGFIYLVAYVLGLTTILLLISLAGQSIVRKLGWLSNPSGFFRRAMGILLIIVAVAVLSGLDRDFQTYVLDNGWYTPIMKIEQNFR